MSIVSKMNEYLINKYLEQKFIKDEDKGKKIDEIYKKIFFKSSPAVRKIMHSIYPRDWGSEEIMYFIENFTRSPEYRRENLDQIKGQLKRLCDIDVKIENENFVELVAPKLKIKVATLTGLGYDSEELKKTLLTDDRYGRCHQYSMSIAYGIPDVGNPRVATSWVSYSGRKPTWLHSWVEMDVENGCMCLDATKNAAIKKDEYYSMFHVDSDDVVYRTKDDLEKDGDAIEKMWDYNRLLGKLYLRDRDKAFAILDRVRLNESESVME